MKRHWRRCHSCGRRPWKALTETIAEWDQFIAVFSGFLEGAFGRENLVSAIAQHPSYERLKELGMQHLDEHGMGQLRELFEGMKQKAEDAGGNKKPNVHSEGFQNSYL